MSSLSIIYLISQKKTEMKHIIHNGFHIVADPAIPDKEFVSIQMRFPKSKKKRIRKKWTKNQKNYTLVEKDSFKIIQSGNNLFLSKKLFTMLKEQLNHNEKPYFDIEPNL